MKKLIAILSVLAPLACFAAGPPYIVNLGGLGTNASLHGTTLIDNLIGGATNQASLAAGSFNPISVSGLTAVGVLGFAPAVPGFAGSVYPISINNITPDLFYLGSVSNLARLSPFWSGTLSSTNVWQTITPEMFGAVGDGSTLDDTAFSHAIAALEFLNKNVGSARLYCAPKVSYALANSIFINNSDYIYGNAVSGQGGGSLSGTGSTCTFQWGNAGTNGFRLVYSGSSGVGGIQLHDISINGSLTAGQFGILFTGTTTVNGPEQLILNNISVRNCDVAVAVTNGADIYIHKLFTTGGNTSLIISRFLPLSGNGVNKYTVEGAHFSQTGFGLINNGGIVNISDGDLGKMYFLGSHANVKDCNSEPGGNPSVVSDGAVVILQNLQATGGSGFGLRETNNGKFILTDVTVSTDANGVGLLQSNTDGREDSVELDQQPQGTILATNLNFAQMTNRLGAHTLDFNSGNISDPTSPLFDSSIRFVANSPSFDHYPVACYYDSSGGQFHWGNLTLFDQVFVKALITGNFNSAYANIGTVRHNLSGTFQVLSGPPTINQMKGIQNEPVLWASNSIPPTLYLTYFTNNGASFAFPLNGQVIPTNFISGWTYSNTLNCAISVTATCTNQTTGTTLMEARCFGGFIAGNGTNLCNQVSGQTNAVLTLYVPQFSNYTFTNTSGTAGIFRGQILIP